MNFNGIIQWCRGQSKRDQMQWFPFWLVEDGDISFYNLQSILIVNFTWC
jgi:hypothetical protein